MGPFFYSKYEIPANSDVFKSLSKLKFLFEIPPKTTIVFFVSFDNNLNLFNPKKFLLILNNDDKKILSTFWSSLVLISFRLCADPIILNFLL